MRDSSVPAWGQDKDLSNLNDIVSWFNDWLSCSSQSCREIMKVLEIPGSRDAVPHSSQQVNISFAQPKHNVCPSPPPHPAVMTGPVQLQAAKEESGTTSKCNKKTELEDGVPKKSWKPKKLKLSAASPTRYTSPGFPRRFLQFRKLLDLIYRLLTFWFHPNTDKPRQIYWPPAVP